MEDGVEERGGTSLRSPRSGQTIQTISECPLSSRRLKEESPVLKSCHCQDNVSLIRRSPAVDE